MCMGSCIGGVVVVPGFRNYPIVDDYDSLPNAIGYSERFSWQEFKFTFLYSENVGLY